MLDSPFPHKQRQRYEHNILFDFKQVSSIFISLSKEEDVFQEATP